MYLWIFWNLVVRTLRHNQTSRFSRFIHSNCNSVMSVASAINQSSSWHSLIIIYTASLVIFYKIIKLIIKNNLNNILSYYLICTNLIDVELRKKFKNKSKNCNKLFVTESGQISDSLLTNNKASYVNKYFY